MQGFQEGRGCLSSHHFGKVMNPAVVRVTLGSHRYILVGKLASVDYFQGFILTVKTFKCKNRRKTAFIKCPQGLMKAYF